ncbi:Endoribonuclease L-PSP [mine drainage metagenome]|uniref:Endoribonuclease L-PSP n=1 Tax=mine drainage metagenome TaxID=410659 RepID=T0ZZF2_9ZZZZ
MLSSLATSFSSPAHWEPGAVRCSWFPAASQTTQTLRNIELILQSCRASLADLVKLNVFMADIGDFATMNAAYLVVMGAEPPVRITVGKAALALGAVVEIDGVAYRPGAVART